jgi:hypothetical protein
MLVPLANAFHLSSQTLSALAVMCGNVLRMGRLNALLAQRSEHGQIDFVPVSP